MNYLQNNIFECFFKEYDRLLFFIKTKLFFFIYFFLEEENIVKSTRNPFNLKTKN